MARTIDEGEADRILLSSSNEDSVGLYEAIWEFNSRFPNTSLGENTLPPNALFARCTRKVSLNSTVWFLPTITKTTTANRSALSI